MSLSRTKRCLLTVIAAAVALLAAGCATQGSDRKEPATEGQPRISEKNRPRLKVDGDRGFTVTEVVRIGSDVRGDYQAAVVMLRQERFDDGIALLEDVTARSPELSAPHIDLGVAYGRVGDYDQAEQHLQTALSLAPNHPVALTELGIVYRRTGRFDEARDSYGRALEIHPYYHYALRNLGVLCDLYLNDLECALQQYEAYAALVVDDAPVQIWIADIKNRLGAGP